MPEDAHMLLRSTVVKYMKVQRDRFEIFNDTDYDWEEYLERLSSDGEWAGERAIVALTELYNISIFVHIAEHQQNIMEFRVDNPSQTVHLLYSSRSHYDLLVNQLEPNHDVTTGDETESSAEEEQTMDSETESSSSRSSFSDTGSGDSGVSRETLKKILFHNLPAEKVPGKDDLRLSDLLGKELKDEESC